MRYYMNQQGVYGGSCIRIPNGMIECAKCPDPDTYTIDPNWQSLDVMNPSIWIPKTQAELNTEKDSKLQSFVNENKEIAAVALWVAQLHGISKADAIAQLKTIYRTL